jgi:GT2 family glycosyltransferase
MNEKLFDLSIILVNYNGKEVLKYAIQSVINTIQEIGYEIIVVDNASDDGSVDMLKNEYPSVVIVENNYNLGFSKANNMGIERSCGKYILLLNSDTEVIDDCIAKCIDYMDKDSGVGALGSRVILTDGSLDHACKRGFPTPGNALCYILKLYKLFKNNKTFGRYMLNYLPDDEINEVDSLTGAFMLLRREVIEEVGLLDEDFFMYGEDIDWCYRIKEAGWKIIYFPKAVTIHYKGGSSGRHRYKIIYEFHRAMWLFYKKHYIKRYILLITLLVFSAIGAKLLVAWLAEYIRSTNTNNKVKFKFTFKPRRFEGKGKSETL